MQVAVNMFSLVLTDFLGLFFWRVQGGRTQSMFSRSRLLSEVDPLQSDYEEELAHLKSGEMAADAEVHNSDINLIQLVQVQ